ncbi:formate--phosphoribosylaminoimidazolecarboxamide ligase family protein [Methanomassiliicoccus luminyensis]|jgi:5-formaminoimidazole-4-carboxamide-1-(beta)-D-ribofuranosyl 5'-monophosphate synthetase|uniref:formate--phosphoribosylaminoimidazolecarboxamide ligase family protein n=1 Tax=Methanomassiliicoccus luminyensis TaxID=1080712 RepID=UPI00037D4F5C|nr:formate--phosphoribosylaminoimidazolecarboxamide ligase family protein [Methanomassiliicoccus luminyensis]
MIERKVIQEMVGDYDLSAAKIGVVGSHSALDTCDGAVEEGLRTLAVCQNGRDSPYSRYFKAFRDANGGIVRGMVDEVMLLPKFNDIMKQENMKRLQDDSVLFVPNRSFTSYVSMDAVENDFMVPLVGSRNLLRSEDRGGPRDYYWLLDKAGLPAPRKITDPKDINSLSIIKLHHAKKKLERGFFTAASYQEYREKSEALIKQGVIERENLEGARMEEYVIGPVFNLDFFYSPLEKEGEKVELIGVDWRFESSLDGHVRIPAAQQLTLNEAQKVPEYTVCGHNSATLRESLLENAFELAEKYVAAAKEYFSPGIIGPFCLQTCVDKDLKFFIYDVAPRIGGGTNVHMNVGHAYGNSLWRKNMSTGRRLAMEVRRALEEKRVAEIVT